MSSIEFDKHYTYILDRCGELLRSRAGQYADNDDRLHNFTVAARVLGCDRKQALAGMMSKHTVSVYDLIRKNAAGMPVPREMWQEKITDHINYLVLLWAMTEEDAREEG